MSRRKQKRRIRKLRRQYRHLERVWEKANRRYGLPARPAIEEHYNKLATITDEIKDLSNGE